MVICHTNFICNVVVNKGELSMILLSDCADIMSKHRRCTHLHCPLIPAGVLCSLTQERLTQSIWRITFQILHNLLLLNSNKRHLANSHTIMIGDKYISTTFGYLNQSKKRKLNG